VEIDTKIQRSQREWSQLFLLGFALIFIIQLSQSGEGASREREAPKE